jgi:hypothetical protein
LCDGAVSHRATKRDNATHWFTSRYSERPPRRHGNGICLGVAVHLFPDDGIFEVGYILFANSTLEGAVREASRLGLTGYAPSASSRQAYIESTVRSYMDSFNIDGEVRFQTKVYDSFENVGKPEPYSDSNGSGSYDAGECFVDINENGVWDEDMGKAGLGGANAIVLYQIDLDLSLLTGLLSKIIGRNGSITLSARTIVKNEPYEIATIANVGSGGSSGGTTATATSSSLTSGSSLSSGNTATSLVTGGGGSPCSSAP